MFRFGNALNVFPGAGRVNSLDRRVLFEFLQFIISIIFRLQSQQNFSIIVQKELNMNIFQIFYFLENIVEKVNFTLVPLFFQSLILFGFLWTKQTQWVRKDSC